MGAGVELESMRLRPLVSPVLVVALGSCALEPPAPLLTTRSVASPAGSDSGQPYLAVAGDAVYMSWLQRAESGGHHLLVSRYAEGVWAEPQVIVTSDQFFVNWADFPSVAPGPDGALWAHWLERYEAGGYAYGVQMARSSDGGATWSTPWTPHEDGTDTEHGFVASVPVGNDMGWVWLDGRRFAEGPSGEAVTNEMALYFRLMGPSGPTGPEIPIDTRVCECCQTDAALTAAGPVLVYRNRDDDEIRDIHVTRWLGGAWSPGTPVHADRWQTGACPVNGPAVSARGPNVVVAWFTAAGEIPTVKVAFSGNSAESFGPPTIVDSGNPSGRVDVLLLADGSALVSWLERTGGDFAEVQVRHVAASGRVGEPLRVSVSSSERASGYPRMVQAPSGEVLVAWTDVSGAAPTVRLEAIDVQPAP